MRPSHVQIYCHGEIAHAIFNETTERWECAKCGSPVKVVW